VSVEAGDVMCVHTSTMQNASLTKWRLGVDLPMVAVSSDIVFSSAGAWIPGALAGTVYVVLMWVSILWFLKNFRTTFS
jgi:hypothetical protein